MTDLTSRAMAGDRAAARQFLQELGMIDANVDGRRLDD